jgi:uncharacterized protein involved in type VI secretion and phage assembly
MITEELFSRLVERVESRYYGKYRGFVVDNADPENRGRLRVRVPGVLGDDVVSGWAMPCAPYGGGPDLGFFFIPEVDAGVWVEFETGNLDYPVWVGTFWAKPGGASELPKPADSQSPPTRKIIRTLKGHSVEMEDNDGEEVFIITYNDGDKTNQISMDKDGIIVTDANDNNVTMSKDGVVVTDANNNKVTTNGDGVETVDANNNKVTMNSDGVATTDANNNKVTMNSDGTAVVDSNGNSVKMSASGVVVEDKNANKIEMSASGINIYPSAACNLGSGAVNLVNNLPACLFTGAPMAIDGKGHAKFVK